MLSPIVNALTEVVVGFDSSLDEYLKAFPRVGGQVGAVFAIDETPVGLDLFEDERIVCSLFPKLLRSYALDAVDAPVGQISMRVNDQPNIRGRRFPTVGMGETARVESRDVVAAALVVDETLIHLAAFDMASQR